MEESKNSDDISELDELLDLLQNKIDNIKILDDQIVDLIDVNDTEKEIDRINNYSTVAYVDGTVISSTSDSTNIDNRDVFGSLRKPWEKRKVTFISKCIKDKIDVKVIRIKNRPKLHYFNDPEIFGNLSNKNPIWYSDVSENSAVDNDLSNDCTLIRNISKQYKDPKEYLRGR
ncbi:pentatricopeptide repeat-containing protein 1, mitochondrial [Nephila pilipes]|uniref:Pentatricopeptide repeat-containing protein 1, mitochondrial n=1 Tax=Nephila pilipes TaxID=299642 RepID=A0A8X6TAX7_NEPPI|nr:pentatricopeptide repeat-containing protein 1, mitochondrial [Nephila pilipes]